ncbi:MAG: OmpA family protein [Chlorobiota bacterium]
MLKSLFTLLSLLSFAVLIAEEEPYYIGIEGGYGLVNYDAGFNQFEGIDKCGIYEDGSGNSFFGRIWCEYNVIDAISIGTHFQYTVKNGILDKPDTAFARDLNTGNIGIIETNNELDVNFNSISVGLDFNFLLQRDLFNGPLYLNLSPSLIVNQTGSFIQKEYIQSPDGAAFEGPNGYFFERTNAEGDFTTLSNMIPVISASLYNSTKIADNLYLTQRIGVTNDMSSLLDDANISSLTLFASLGIKLSFEKKKEVIIVPPKKPIQPEPIIPVPEPIISLNMEVDYENTYIIEQEELFAEPPMVMALFFDKNSSEIRSQYLADQLNTSDPIQMHNGILGNIRDIMLSNPDAMLTLKSSTSGSDEKNDISLARRRAQAVKNHLLKLGIDSSSINSTSQILPKVPTNSEYEDGLEENRRVEFQLSNIRLERVGTRTTRKELYTRIEVITDTENLQEKAKLSTSFDDEKYSVYDTTLSFNYNQNLIDNNFDKTNFTSSLVSNELSEKDSEVINLSEIETRKLETKFNNFELYLLFNFSSSVLSDENKKAISDLIDLLPEGKTIEIIGNTDKIGMEKANIEIAQNRANNTREYIESITTKQYEFDIKTNTSKFDETTPQGRFLNRSIRIRIK